MGERQSLNSSLQGDNGQGRQHVEQPYIQMATTGTPESSTFIYTLDNLTVEGEQLNPQRNSASMPVGNSSSNLHAELPYYHMQILDQSHDPLAHSSAGGSYMVQAFPVNEHSSADGSLNMVQALPFNGHHVPQSNHSGQQLHRVNDGFLEPTFANSRGQLKRRSPGIPVIHERGSTSRYLDAGSSSDHLIPSNPQLEAPNSDSYHAPNYVPFYRGSGLSIGGEGNLRNVRSRPSFDLENNQAHAQFSNPPHSSSFTITYDNLSSLGFLASNSTAPLSEWNPGFPPPASLRRNAVSDPNLFGSETSHFNVVNGNPGASLWMGGHVNDSFSNRNVATQTLHDFSGQHARGVRSSYVQGPVPNFGAASRNLSIGNMSLSDQGTQFAEDSTYPRPPSTLVSRTGERNGRNRTSSDRYRTSSESAHIRDRLMNEVMNAQIASRSMFDQHRDMRLDTDNMSYEELLALVERIGNVNTGLSDDLVPKCLTELIYCSSDYVQDEARCVICLEEYKHMDDIGTLKKCGHDFHVQCIRKWLSIKNLCPICKAAALDDKMKNK